MALALALVGGYVDAVGFVTLYRLFTSHQSGNSDGLGVALSTGDWTMAWRRSVSIGAFVAGVALGTVIVELTRRWRARFSGLCVALGELVALATALAVGLVSEGPRGLAPVPSWDYVAAAASLAGAMGLQTVILRRVGRQTVRTTFVTGTLTTMTESFVLSCFSRGSQRRDQRRASRLSGSIWTVYLAGALAGGAAASAWRFAALGLPVAAIGVAACWLACSATEADLPGKLPAS